jgi:hypothetical protein
LNVWPLKIASRPMTSEVSVGMIYSLPSRTKVLFGESVVISNSPFPKPSTLLSYCQTSVLNVLKSSSRTWQSGCLNRGTLT